MSSSSSIISDLTLPKDVINYCAGSFLTDREVINVACCCRAAVRTFSQYRIKSVLPFATALWFARNQPSYENDNSKDAFQTPDVVTDTSDKSSSSSSSSCLQSSVASAPCPPCYLFPTSSESIHWFRVGRSDISSILLHQQDIDALQALNPTLPDSDSVSNHSSNTLSTLFPPLVGNINSSTSSIRHVAFADNCDADSFATGDALLPEGLLTLTIGYEYRGELCRISLPTSLQRLEVAQKSPLVFESESNWSMPQGLKHLTVTTDMLDLLCAEPDEENEDHEKKERCQLDDGEDTYDGTQANLLISDLFRPKHFPQRNYESLAFKGPPTEMAPDIVFPPTLTSLSWSFRNLPDLKSLPPSLMHLSLDVKLPSSTAAGRRSSPLTITYLPPMLHSLHISGEILFHPTSESDFFPQSLRTVSFSNCNLQLNQIQLPSQLTTLELRCVRISFNKVLLPPSLTSFVCTAPMNRNSPLNMIWSSANAASRLRHLNLSTFNDQLISELSFPPALTSLILPGFAADMFLQSGGGAANAFDCSGLMLPETLEELTFGYWFNSPISGIKFPPNIKCIKFQTPLLHQNISTVHWPQSLHTLEMAGHYVQNLHAWNPPPALTRLVLSGEFNCDVPASMRFPPTLTHLTFSKTFTRSLSEWSVPASLRTLEFERIGAWNLQPANHLKLNENLEKLMFCYHFNQNLEGHHLPLSLRELYFYGAFNQSLAPLAQLPNLETLVINSDFNQSLSGPGWKVPDSLRILELGSYWNLSFQGMIVPHNLQELVFSTDFDQDLAALVQQTPKLKKLVLGKEFKQSLLPLSGLKELHQLQLFAERNFPFPAGKEWWPPSLHCLTLQLEKWKAESDSFCASQIPCHVKMFEINRGEADNPSSPYQFLIDSALTGKLHEKCLIVGFESKRF